MSLLRPRTLVACVAATLLLSVSASAQTGRIAGRVLDAETRRPLPGASVRVMPSGLGDVSGDDGRFSIDGLEPGRHLVDVRFVGFEPVVRPDVEVAPGRATVIEIVLREAVYETDEVVVSAGWFEGGDDEPAPVLLFSREEIRRAPGAAGDVQRMLAGLASVSRMDDMRNALAVRGGSPLETRFLVDGIPVPNLSHFPTQGASGGALGIVPADLIGDVVFRPGGFGAEHPDRLGAVVGLDLRPVTDRPLAFRGDFSIAGAGAFAEGSTGDRRFTWLGGVRRSWVDLLVTGFLEEQADAVPTYSDGIFRATWRPSNRHEIRLLDLAAIDRSGIGRTRAVEQHENFFGSSDFDANAVGIRWSALRGSTGLGITTVSHAWMGRRVSSQVTATGRPYLEDRSDEHVLSLAHGERMAWAGVGWIDLGADVQHEIGRYRTRFAEADAHLRPTLDRTRVGGHATLSWRPTPRLRIEPGFRVDFGDGWVRFQPRGSVRYVVRPDISARFALGRYVQQLPIGLVAQAPAHAGLAPPEAVHGVIGLAWDVRPATRLSLEAYVKRYRRLPLDPATPFASALDLLYDDAQSMPQWPLYTELSADGVASASGIELALHKRLARSLYGLVSLSVNRSEYRDMTGTWRPRIFENGLIVTIDGGYRPDERNQIGVRFTWAGGRPYTPFDVSASEAAGTGVFDWTRVQAARMPAYHALALRYDRRFSVAGAWVVGYLSVWNVYGRRNLSGYYWDEVEGRIRERVQWGVLPVIGFEVIFR